MLILSVKPLRIFVHFKLLTDNSWKASKTTRSDLGPAGSYSQPRTSDDTRRRSVLGSIWYPGHSRRPLNCLDKVSINRSVDSVIRSVDSVRHNANNGTKM